MQKTNVYPKVLLITIASPILHRSAGYVSQQAERRTTPSAVVRGRRQLRPKRREDLRITNEPCCVFEALPRVDFASTITLTQNTAHAQYIKMRPQQFKKTKRKKAHSMHFFMHARASSFRHFLIPPSATVSNRDRKLTANSL